MKTSPPVINYPVEGTVLFNTVLDINYKFQGTNLEVYSIVFSLDAGEPQYDSAFTGVYRFTGLSEGSHTLTGYLARKDNSKISGTDFSITFDTFETTLDVENKITNVLKSTIPSFVKEDYGNFITFIQAYYEWLYSSNNPFYAPLISEDYKDVDRTPDEFIKYFRKQYLKDFPESLTTDRQTGTPLNIKTLLKNIVDFYSSKGTEKSIKFLLKILYDSYSEIYYPKKDLFKPSDSTWVAKKSIKFTCSSEYVYKIKDKELVQKIGDTVLWKSKIDSMQVYRTANKQIVEVFYTNEEGTLDFNYGFEVQTDYGIVPLSAVLVVSDLEITDGGLNYKINDSIKISKSNQDVAFATVQEVSEQGTITKIAIVNFGATQDISGSYTVTVTSDFGSDATFDITEGYVCVYTGYWVNKNSHPDTIKALSDNYRYQNMSYVIRTDRSLDRYIAPLKKLAHPAGIAVIGDILIQQKLIEPTEIQDVFAVVYTPLIGNYAAYRIQTSTDVRKSSKDLFPHGFDPNRPIPAENGSGSDFIHTPISPISASVSSTVFSANFIPNVSDASSINTYWVVYPHPNTEINTSTDSQRFMDIKLLDFLKQVN
jgi:hypothetical protein